MQVDSGDADDSGKRWEMMGEMVGPTGEPFVLHAEQLTGGCTDGQTELLGMAA